MCWCAHKSGTINVVVKFMVCGLPYVSLWVCVSVCTDQEIEIGQKHIFLSIYHN